MLGTHQTQRGGEADGERGGGKGRDIEGGGMDGGREGGREGREVGREREEGEGGRKGGREGEILFNMVENLYSRRFRTEHALFGEANVAFGCLCCAR